MGSNLKLRNHPVLWAAIGLVVTIVLAVGVVLALQPPAGGAKAVSDNAPLIAAVIALGGVLTAQMVSIALEQQRTREARDLEAQRAHEAALQNYFEEVGKLLIEQPLYKASPGDRLSAVVRAQTLSVLAGLDPDRKRILLLFLYESGLIYRRKLVVSLGASDLREANLREANLREADLSEVSLFKADLNKANLSEANLSEANLSEANLSKTNLNKAYLRAAGLNKAYLSKTNLSGATLSGADLSGANLSKATLKYARNTSEHQLATAKSLQDATMPNGQKYEERLKEKKAKEKDEKNE
jgi:hypothetical protein